MTRKDYELIAGVLDEQIRTFDPSVHDVIIYLANELANALYIDNPRFDRARFLKACGIEVA